MLRRRGLALALLWPAMAVAQAPDRKAQLDGVLAQLRAAPTEEAAARLEGEARRIWGEAASAVLRLLLTRATRELNEGAAGDAADSFDAALDLDPDLLEGWRGRAQARMRLGDTAGAVRDIGEVLRREPRYFPALQDLSQIAEAGRDWRGALAAWQKLLDMTPRTPGGQARLQDLRRRALGEAL